MFPSGQSCRRSFTDKCTKCICLGNAKDHAADVYRVYNTVTKSTQFSRDISGQTGMAVSHQLRILRKLLHATWLERTGQKVKSRIWTTKMTPTCQTSSPRMMIRKITRWLGPVLRLLEELLVQWLQICRLPEMAWQLDSGPQIWGGMVEESLLQLVRQLWSHREHRKCLLQGRSTL